MAADRGSSMVFYREYFDADKDGPRLAGRI